MQLLVYPLTVFCLGLSEMQVSHICIQRAENSICYVVYSPFSGVGGGSAIYYWQLFHYFLLDVISFFFFFFSFNLRGFSGVSHLPHRLSPYVFLFLVNKRFQGGIAFNYKQPQVQG